MQDNYRKIVLEDELHMNRAKWILGEIKWLLKRGICTLFGSCISSDRKYGQYELDSAEDGNKRIDGLIRSGAPFAFCRFSFSETDLIVRCRTEDYFGIKSYALKCLGKHKKDFVKTFKVDGESKYYGIRRFYDLMKESIMRATILGIWKNLPMGDTFIDSLPDISDKYLIDAKAVEPYFFEKPWSKALEGKRVLVVSPFSDEIQSQYGRRQQLWRNSDVLPKFDLITVDSVWYFFGCKDDRFSNWFEALDFLFVEIMKQDFDIALLGCGPFGFPLAAKIKESGKQAIQMGGAVQVLFGIKGKRWDQKMNINRFYNQYWIRPGKKTMPDEANKLDGGCYW